jgi:hypothetical protein
VGYEWLLLAVAQLGNIEPHEVAQVLSGRRRLPLAATSAGMPFIAISGRTGR